MPRAATTGRVVLHAPAKINLDLTILHRRADGFHELRTILQSLALHDTVSLTARPGPLSVRSRSPWVPRDRANLVWTAAEALWCALGRPGRPAGVAISIVKGIPAEAGLGGASSDAAAAMRGLRRLWDRSASDRLLGAVAARVGSDVPFFLHGGTVAASGRGERLRALAPVDRYWVLIALPAFGVSTAAAYRWWDAMVAERVARRRGAWRTNLAVLRNDLERPVVARHPEIGVMIARVRTAGAIRAAMTGSGSAVFGLFRTRVDAVGARRWIRWPGWRTMLTRTVGRTECARLAEGARFD